MRFQEGDVRLARGEYGEKRKGEKECKRLNYRKARLTK
jgi:hypothetical protein